MSEVDVQIRRAKGLEDYQAILQLQEQVWGFTELGDVAGIPMLVIASRCGGAVLVAEEYSGRLVGFSLAYLGRSGGKLFWWSHMTAVSEDYRNKSLGLRLKLYQRQEALAAGIEEIHWTFDPLQALNAHFNVHKLGVIVREYEENIYGHSSSTLHRGLPTDRFVGEWHLKSDRVTQRISTTEPTFILRDFDRLTIINRHGREADLQLKETPLLLEIPPTIGELKQTNPAASKAWQDSVRTACMHYFAAGYAITDFILVQKPHSQALYVLEKQS